MILMVIARSLFWALLWYILLVILTVGITCYRHGDQGPYPEADIIPYLPIVAVIMGYLCARKIV